MGKRVNKLGKIETTINRFLCIYKYGYMYREGGREGQREEEREREGSVCYPKYRFTHFLVNSNRINNYN